MTETRRILWIDSHTLQTEAYRGEFQERGYSVEPVGCAHDAIPFLDLGGHNAIVLNPWLSYGMPRISQFHNLIWNDHPMCVGLWVYRGIRTDGSINKDKPLIIIVYGEREQEIFSEVSSGTTPILDLSKALPINLVEIVEAELAKALQR